VEYLLGSREPRPWFCDDAMTSLPRPIVQISLGLTSIEEALGHARKAVRLQGSFSHDFLIWEKVITLRASGKFDPLRIKGRIEGFANWRTWSEEMGAGKIVKAVLKPARASA
jgi:threonine dehydrogenase-like Zn-dependent dehydrogenase